MFAALALLALPLLAKADFIEGCTRTAVVKAGDTCDELSTRHGVSTFQFALVNDETVDTNCHNLQINQTVCLGVSGQDCTKIYTVVEDDTCDWIQQQYGIANETLYANNPQINADCTNIYIGEVLCVDTKAFTYPAYNATLFEAVAGSYVPYCDDDEDY